ncbi:MAG TPA: L-threonylcarbamoyladenylate synthase [Bacteroidia bacterium]|jgi:tRNA threonylcarbamoyl adenosine modification protein (Sua5/YciO/YrdC/YwlC family)|nr:L-threonylcarbamoyladenylate synthase [Bacteroidia bacterium]
MLLRINPDKPDSDSVHKAADILRAGGIIIYPTDTVYGIGCDITNSKALDKLCRIKGIKLAESNFSIICHDLSHLSDYCKPISTSVFRVLKKALPGPYTFILAANSNVPKIFQSKKKTVGIRVPANPIVQEVIKALGNPIVSSSVHNTEDELMDYFSDPELIYEKYKNVADAVINGGYGNIQASTVIDVTKGEFEIVREGLGSTENLW